MYKILQEDLAERNEEFLEQIVPKIEKYLGGNKFFGGSRVSGFRWSERARNQNCVCAFYCSERARSRIQGRTVDIDLV